MSIEELEDKHGNIPLEPLNFDEFHYKKHTKLSIEFAISVLERLSSPDIILYPNLAKEICDKIQELKQYLDE